MNMEELKGTYALAMSLLNRDNLDFNMMTFTLELIGHQDYTEALRNYDVVENCITLINRHKTIIIKIK